MTSDAARESAARLIDEWRRREQPDPTVEHEERHARGQPAAQVNIVHGSDPVLALAWAIRSLPPGAEIAGIHFELAGEAWRCELAWRA